MLKSQLLINKYLLLIISLFLFLILLLFFQFQESYLNFNSYTVFIVLAGLVLLIRQSSIISAPVLIYVAFMYPALAPSFSWILTENTVYSGWNVFLQEDVILTNKVLGLFCLAAVSMTIGSIFFPIFKNNKISKDEVKVKFSLGMTLILGVVFLLACYLSEPGGSIISTRYSQMRPAETLLSGSFSSQLLILSWVLLFSFSRHRKVIFNVVTILGVCYLLLHARRSEPLGIILILLMHHRSYFSKKVLFLLIASGFLTFSSIEILRDKGVSSTTFEDFGRVYDKKTLLPGASNIMITVPDIVHLKDNNLISSGDKVTFDMWVLRLIPTPLLNYMNMENSKLEGDIINRSYLGYMGGMHILGIMYLNGGVFLIIFFAFWIGYYSSYIERIFLCEITSSFSSLVAVLFIFGSFRLFWYHPIGFLKQILYVLLVWIVIKSIIKSRKVLSK
jgi:hypothetical protein